MILPSCSIPLVPWAGHACPAIALCRRVQMHTKIKSLDCSRESHPVPHCLCRYSSLRTNLPRHIMSFSDFPLTVETMGERSHDHRV